MFWVWQNPQREIVHYCIYTKAKYLHFVLYERAKEDRGAEGLALPFPRSLVLDFPRPPRTHTPSRTAYTSPRNTPRLQKSRSILAGQLFRLAPFSRPTNCLCSPVRGLVDRATAFSHCPALSWVRRFTNERYPVDGIMPFYSVVVVVVGCYACDRKSAVKETCITDQCTKN